VQIDYEVADLELASGSVKRSPMGYFYDPNDPNNPNPEIEYIDSDRYVLLQTYTFHNSDPNTSIENLSFYQFLHSHGADEYEARVNSCYVSAATSDALETYTPFDSVHQTDNFRYDITQWNSSPYSGHHSTHTDYTGFSCTIEPDWIDNDVYEGGHSYGYYIPPRGTHLHIESRQLNNVPVVYKTEAAGAMGWSLGTLAPNESQSITIAYMCGHGEPAEPNLYLGKTDGLPETQEVVPGDEFTYTIEWENYGDVTAQNAVLVDYLPKGVDYPKGFWGLDPNTSEFIPPDPNYNQEAHTYTWNLGTIAPSETGSRTLDVVVNEASDPTGTLHNVAVLSSNLGDVTATEDTPVDCWDNDNGIIYVNKNATGYNNGIDWQNSYVDLQDALDRAAAGCSNIIFVAAGTYSPGREAIDTFEIPDGVSVYGGFVGWEDTPSQRSIKAHPTILTGIGGIERNETVVTMGDDTLLDGFTITDAANYGIYGSGVDFNIENCTVVDNLDYGIRAVNGNITLKWCYVKNNGSYGIRHEGTGFTINAENCWIMKNMRFGIFCSESTPVVRNSIVSESDLSESGSAGIRMINPTNMPILHNNTFAHNRNVGISFVDNGTVSDPNSKDYPDVKNCVLWYNNNGGDQLSGFGKQQIYYSCVYDPNDPDGENPTKDTHLNFSTNPKFAYFDPNNVHIAFDSPCKNAGDPNGNYNNQVDMDNRDRVVGDTVDAGAYEVDCEDVSNSLDWNADGLVNLYEFNFFAKAWLTYDPNNPLCDPNNPGYVGDPNAPGYISQLDKDRFNPDCDLDSDFDVDLGDLMMFCEDAPQIWLWKACWMTQEYLSEMMASGDQQMMVSNIIEQTPALSDQMQMSTASTDIIGIEEVQAVSEPVVEVEISVEEQISELKDSIEFLEQIWQENPDIQNEIDPDQWREFMEAVRNSLLELQTDTVQIE